MPTALSIINRAAELIGYKDPSETLSGDDAQNFLGALNSMVDAMAADSLMVYAVTTITQSVSGNPVTVGTGATVNTPRPIRIPSGGFFRVGAADYPFAMISREDYAAKLQKAQTASFPRECYYEPALPSGKLYFYPALSGSAELHLPVEQRLSEFTDLSTDYTLAPACRKMLEYSLAEELAPGRGALSPEARQIGINTRRAVRRLNLTVPQLDSELMPATFSDALRPLQ